MRAVLQFRDEHLVVGLEGEADARVAPLSPDCEVFLAIDDQIELFDPRELVVDFRDLRYLDAQSLGALLVELSRYSIAREVRCVGPGAALRRLASLFPSALPLEFAASVQDALAGKGARLPSGATSWGEFLAEIGCAPDESWTEPRPVRSASEPDGAGASDREPAEEGAGVSQAAKGSAPDAAADLETNAARATAGIVPEPARNEIVIDSEREAAYLLGQSRPGLRVNPLHRPIEFQRKKRASPP